MQYAITLPADYDMKIIRDRVAKRGHLLDQFPGLHTKAYLILERGVDGSPINQYAPFYCWNAIDGMTKFLCGGGGFSGVVDSFGRPEVQHWAGLVYEDGPAKNAVPLIATRYTEMIPEHKDPEIFVQQAIKILKNRSKW